MKTVTITWLTRNGPSIPFYYTGVKYLSDDGDRISLVFERFTLTLFTNNMCSIQVEDAP